MKSSNIQEIKRNNVLKKRLAKQMALACFRNTELENLHAGIVPSTKTGDYSDVKVVYPGGEISWKDLSRFNDREMKKLMIEVVNNCYAYLFTLFNSVNGDRLVEALRQQDLVPHWNEPTFETGELAWLKELEREGEWVFHGTEIKTEVLEPQQAYNYPNNSEEGKNPDDKPAVFATSSADVAVFMAIINKNNAPMGARSGFSLSEDKISFRATKATMDQIQPFAYGYVYVFPKKKFEKYGKNEFVSYEKVRPESVICVSKRDLPRNIEIKDF